MSSGIVKWYNSNEGYGFITGFDGTEIYFHAASILDNPEDQWPSGTQVEFDLIHTQIGPEATNIRCAAAFWQKF